jgi:hypothetical protein
MGLISPKQAKRVKPDAGGRFAGGERGGILSIDQVQPLVEAGSDGLAPGFV